MSIYPGAVVNLLDKAYSGFQPLTQHNRMNLHVAVSEAPSLHGYFNQPGRPSSHFYVRKDGVVEQMVDTNWRAEADLEGNDATVSVETQGGLYDPQGEPWTPEQVEALAHLFAWAVREHGIVSRLAEDSKIGASSKGLSWHRLGIDGNFPAAPNPLAGRLQRGGGMHYSTSRGKVCPGDAKILQVPEILARSQQINGGAVDVPVVVPPAPNPIPTPPVVQHPKEFAMNVSLPVIDLRNANTKPVKGADVGRLEGLLLAAGYGPAGLVGKDGRPDNVAGPGVRRIIGQLQQAHPETGSNGAPDYVVGPKVWGLLIEG